MTVFDLLHRQQRELDAMFDELQLCADDDAWYLFQTVSTRWIAMMRAEHATVYPHLAARDGDLHGELREAARADEEIERGINHARLAPLCPLEWREAVRDLRVRIADRATWEQYVLGPLAHLTMSPAELSWLARSYLTFQPVALTTAAASITYDPAPPARAEPPTVAIPLAS
ncbi:MAG: hypothetical protein KF773_42825 [Deltaproteobacteria bacterium]|nr:hypothetical protein [Deltaproteobacteria bacterium]MCW5808503.1 hypothetical protein [Deltaproteobacteria bacterium]